MLIFSWTGEISIGHAIFVFRRILGKVEITKLKLRMMVKERKKIVKIGADIIYFNYPVSPFISIRGIRFKILFVNSVFKLPAYNE